MTERTRDALAREAREDFGDRINRTWVVKNKAAKVLSYHEKSIRNFVNLGRLNGYRDKQGYRIETLSMAAFLYQKAPHLSRALRYQIVYELFSAHGLLRK